MSLFRPRVLVGLVVVWSVACGDDPPQSGPGDDSSSGDPLPVFTTADPTTGSGTDGGGSSGSSSETGDDTIDATQDDTRGPDPSTSSAEDSGSSTTLEPRACPDPLIECDGACIDPNKDEAWCGASDPCADDPGVVCPAGEVCAGGECQVLCPPGQVECFGSCINAGVTCCGDGECAASENVQTCAIDCVVCGDGSCDAPETAASCASDCTTCAHAPCEIGGPLAAACDACVADVCDVAPQCCSTGWDATCVDALPSACGLTCPQCGDAECTWPEDASTCAADCTCGDGLCSAGEGAADCPADCLCGDGACTGAETVLSCEDDCTICGDGFCTAGEDTFNCAVECTVCGDGLCTGVENAIGCLTDCTTCGDGYCTGPEDAISCLEDCLECGDGVCSPGEDALHCGADCSTCGDGLCTGAEDAATCAGDCTSGFCDDQVCQFGETGTACLLDCGSDCCVEHPTGGCDVPYCTTAVCGFDPDCCLGDWDGLCDELAFLECGGLCTSENACADLDLAVAVTAQGPIAPFGDDFAAPCGDELGPEAVIEFTAAISGVYTFDTIGSNYDTVLWALGDCSGVVELACDDDGAGEQSSISLALGEGTTIVLLVGGSSGAVGEFVLNVTYP